MAVRRTLREPPITEALVDLRTTPIESIGPEAFETLKRTLQAEFPKHGTRRQFEGRLTKHGDDPPTFEGRETIIRGYLFRNSEETEIAQFRVDGFTYNRLKPYQGGDALIERALWLWSVHSAVVAPAKVVRLALRYINHLKFPAPIESFADYLVSPPQPPPDLAGRLEKFLSRVTVNDASTSLQVHLTQSSEAGVDGRSVTILVDIDAFRVADVGTARDAILPTLEALRDLKNRAFFGAVTERALESHV